MNKVVAFFTGCLMLGGMNAPSLAQNTYICPWHGQAVYTTVKMNPRCQLAKINGLAQVRQAVFAPPIAVASEVALPNDEQHSMVVAVTEADPIAQIWYEYEYGSYDRTPILPPPPPRGNGLAKQPETVKPSVISTPSRVIVRTTPRRAAPAAVVYQAVAVPVLSRREVLIQEITREQTALKVAQTQLAIAQKRHDSVNVLKLNSMVRDRLANVQSLQRELQR